MKYNHKIFIVFILSFFSLSFGKGWGGASFAQNKSIDSLLILIKKDKPDTIKVKHLISIADELRNINPGKSVEYAKQALLLSEEKKYNPGIGAANIIMGSATTNLGNYEEALKYLTVGLDICKRINDNKNTARAFSNIGVVYRHLGYYPKALDCYFKALEIDEKVGNKNGITRHLGNIGNIYCSQGDYFRALSYHFKALKIGEEIADKNGIARHFGNIGNVYKNQGDYSKASYYYFKSLKITEELGDKNGIMRNFGNLGNVYFILANYPKALDHYFKALKMAEELGDKNYSAVPLSSIGSIYTKTGKFKEAEEYLKRAIVIDSSISALDELRQDYEFISQLYDTIGKDKEALVYYKKSVTLKDTIFSQENRKQLVQKEMKYEFEKTEAITKAENEKQQAIAEEKSRKQKLILFFVSCVLILVFVFAGFIFRSLRITRKQKQLIESKSAETELQKKIIEEKNKGITDSIHYAKRIQDALLREETHVSMHLPEHFILFLPKDIVSGDFYWGAEKNEYWYFAAVDCTGHGVPGAVMSMLGISFLNDIVSSNGLLSPAEILNRLRDKVVKELRQTGESGGSKDGMDISLCRLNLKSNELQWAGAYNPLNLFRNGQLEELKADKQPIGYYPESRPFTNHEIQLQKGDSIYIYSDGYADQFGGPKGKKFKYKQLEDLIIANNQLAMNDQKEILKKCFIEWKGSLEQIDDVCLFGVRI